MLLLGDGIGGARVKVGGNWLDPAEKNFLPMQPGDVPHTYANIDALADATGFSPSTPIEVGVQKFVDWYLEYYD